MIKRTPKQTVKAVHRIKKRGGRLEKKLDGLRNLNLSEDGLGVIAIIKDDVAREFLMSTMRSFQALQNTNPMRYRRILNKGYAHQISKMPKTMPEHLADFFGLGGAARARSFRDRCYRAVDIFMTDGDIKRLQKTLNLKSPKIARDLVVRVVASRAKRMRY